MRDELDSDGMRKPSDASGARKLCAASASVAAFPTRTRTPATSSSKTTRARVQPTFQARGTPTAGGSSLTTGRRASAPTASVLGSEAASEEDESKSESELSPEGRTRTRTTTRKRRRTGRRFALAKHSCDRGGYPAGRRVASENLYPRFLPARRTTYQPPRRGPLCVFERSRRTGRSAMAETGTVPRIAGE